MQEKTTKGEFFPSMCRLAHTKGGGRGKKIKTKNKSKDGGLWFCFALSSSSKEKRKNNLVSGILYFRQPPSLHFFFVRRKDSLLPIYFTNCCGLPQRYYMLWHTDTLDQRTDNVKVIPFWALQKYQSSCFYQGGPASALTITVSH